MSKLGRPLGLIRYSSQAAMAGEKAKTLRPRVIIYPAIVTLFLGLIVFLIATRSPVDVTLLRGLGLPFITTEAGQIENVVRVKMTNRTEKPLRLHITAADRTDVRALATQDTILIDPGQSWVEPVRVLAAPSAFTFGTLDVTLRINGDGVKIDRNCRLLGPMTSMNNSTSQIRPAGEPNAKP